MKENAVFKMVFKGDVLTFVDQNAGTFFIEALNYIGYEFVQAITVRDKETDAPVTLAFFSLEKK